MASKSNPSGLRIRTVRQVTHGGKVVATFKTKKQAQSYRRKVNQGAAPRKERVARVPRSTDRAVRAAAASALLGGSIAPVSDMAANLAASGLF